MQTVRIVFFGTTDDSVGVLSAIRKSDIPGIKLEVVCVVTQPPRPVGRSKEPVGTAVAAWADAKRISTLTFANDPAKPWLIADEAAAANAIATFKPDLILSACYGQKIPMDAIRSATFGGLNIHPSPLPRWRGADPVPWTILSGDSQTGVSLVTLEEKFDAGMVIAQKKVPVTDKAEPDALRSRLFTLGTDLFLAVIADVVRGHAEGVPQDAAQSTYARKLTRQDGFVSPKSLGLPVPQPDETDSPLLSQSMRVTGETMPQTVVRMIRALSPWPGVWTLVRLTPQGHGDGIVKRMKVLDAHVANDGTLIIDHVQLEGKQPVTFAQFHEAYFPT